MMSREDKQNFALVEEQSLTSKYQKDLLSHAEFVEEARKRFIATSKFAALHQAKARADRAAFRERARDRHDVQERVLQEVCCLSRRSQSGPTDQEAFPTAEDWMSIDLMGHRGVECVYCYNNCEKFCCLLVKTSCPLDRTTQT